MTVCVCQREAADCGDAAVQWRVYAADSASTPGRTLPVHDNILISQLVLSMLINDETLLTGVFTPVDRCCLGHEIHVRGAF